MNNHYDDLKGRLFISSSEQASSILTSAENFEKLAVDCLKDEKTTFGLLTAQAYKLDYATTSGLLKPTTREERLLFQKIKKIYKSNNPSRAIFVTTSHLRKKMREIEGKIDFSKVRVFTHEDQADEVAVKILHSMGISIHAFNEFLINNISNCNYKSDLEPAYGQITDIHHNGCWRAYRNRLLEEALLTSYE